MTRADDLLHRIVESRKAMRKSDVHQPEAWGQFNAALEDADAYLAEPQREDARYCFHCGSTNPTLHYVGCRKIIDAGAAVAPQQRVRGSPTAPFAEDGQRVIPSLPASNQSSPASSHTPEDASKLVEELQQVIDATCGEDVECQCAHVNSRAIELIESLQAAIVYWRDATGHTLDRATEGLREELAAAKRETAEFQRMMNNAVLGQRDLGDRLEKAECETEQIRAQTIEECAKVCEKYGAEQWDRYKRGDHTNPDSGRANPHTQGLSCGADICADAIRALAAPSAEREPNAPAAED